MMLRKIVLLPLLLVSLLSVAQANTEFPGRAKYPAVPVMEKTTLKDKFGQVTIVDTRSSLEFETLRVKGAVNIPVASKTFVEQLKALRATHSNPIVFYCNGRTCYKSYRAVELGQKAKIKELYAYDAGMFEWAKSYPSHAVLLGESPIKPHDIISGGKFKQRLLQPSAFSDKAYGMGSKSLVLDIRDKYQRGAAGFFPGKERWVSLDQKAKLQEYIEQAKQENKTLFIYDDVGKQVRWVQYALEKANVKDYYFMDKGAKAYYTEMMKEFGIPTR